MIEIVSAQAHDVNGLALIAKDGAVWRTFARPWWDLASWLWWFLCPGKKAWIVVRRESGKVRVRAVRMAKSHVVMGQ